MRLAGNRLEDVLFGIYLREAPSTEVAGNEIRGKALAGQQIGHCDMLDPDQI